jgi:hypothetical protein
MQKTRPSLMSCDDDAAGPAPGLCSRYPGLLRLTMPHRYAERAKIAGEGMA